MSIVRYDPERHHRRSIRLRGYDYAQAGAYFVTICTYQRACLFGEVVDSDIRLSPLGEIIASCWDEIPNHFPAVALDASIVMPNHLHGILVIGGGDGDEGTACRAPTEERFGKPVAGSLPTTVRSFKAAASKRTNDCR